MSAYLSRYRAVGGLAIAVVFAFSAAVPRTAAAAATRRRRARVTTTVAPPSTVPVSRTTTTTTKPNTKTTKPTAPKGVELYADDKGKLGVVVVSFPTTAKVHRFAVELGANRPTVRYRWRFTALATLGGENVPLGESSGVLRNVTSIEGSLEFPGGAPEGTYRVSLTIEAGRPLVRNYEVVAK